MDKHQRLKRPPVDIAPPSGRLVVLSKTLVCDRNSITTTTQQTVFFGGSIRNSVYEAQPMRFRRVIC
jgi:hypothetical protein